MRRNRETRNQRRARLRQTRERAQIKTELTIDDIHAAQCGKAIQRHSAQVIHAPRINFTYRLDGFVVPSGKKHRKIG
jgi:hypothetical protein